MRRPNFILVMTDDQGYGDLSCMGCPDFSTPHFDRMAAEGCRFSTWYSNSPVCSPSRAAFLTGRYPGNAGVRSILAGHRRASGLTSAAPTVASALKRLGYKTGIVGKWHLGTLPESRPRGNGFDYFYGFTAGCIDYFSHIFYWGMADGGSDPVHDLWEDEAEIERNGSYFTELVTEKATAFIREHSRAANSRDGGAEPFLLYVAFNAPHYPMHAPRKYLDRFPRLSGERRTMAAMIAAVDDGIGEIRAELERDGLSEDTFILFMSDNGPSRESRNWLDGTVAPYYGGSSGPFKGHKFSLFEGGIRVPAIACWPGRVPAGRVIGESCAAMDAFPTVLAMAGGDTAEYELDGQDLSGLLFRGEAPPPRDLFWEMGEQTAMRRGRYKLVLKGQLVEGEPPQAPVFLSDLEEDPGERRNLAAREPGLAAEMRAAAEAWREGIERRWTEQWKGGAGGLA
jgi:Arylsulfatase A and related enzymes